jgi:hypothetical protein
MSDHFLVPCELLELRLDASHSSTGRGPGVYAALVMPRYLSSVARMSPGPDVSGIVLGGGRMIQALEYIHSKGLVHMDVKVRNPFMSTIKLHGAP